MRAGARIEAVGIAKMNVRQPRTVLAQLFERLMRWPKRFRARIGGRASTTQIAAHIDPATDSDLESRDAAWQRAAGEESAYVIEHHLFPRSLGFRRAAAHVRCHDDIWQTRQ